MGFSLMKRCESCDSREERVFTDSWMGLDLCPTCLAGVINQVTMSPATEGDNLKALLDAADEDGTAWLAQTSGWD